MNKQDKLEENQRIFEGMKRAVRRVVEEAKRNDEELVISQNGKVVRVKARDL